MSRTQLGLRLSHDEADALRRAAKARRMSLGELVTTLLRDDRAQRGGGIWLDLDPVASTALRACAAAAEVSPEELMVRFARRWLTADLERLRSALSRGESLQSLDGTTAPTTANPIDGAGIDLSSYFGADSADPLDDIEEPDAALFTVSED